MLEDDWFVFVNKMVDTIETEQRKDFFLPMEGCSFGGQLAQLCCVGTHVTLAAGIHRFSFVNVSSSSLLQLNWAVAMFSSHAKFTMFIVKGVNKCT